MIQHNQPLTGWKVAVLRSPEQSQSLTTRLTKHGAEVIGIPTIQTVLPEDRTPLHHAIAQLSAGAFHWVVFTSTNAVRFVAQQLTSPLPPHTNVATVGRATAKVTHQYHLESHLQPPIEQQNALGLIDTFPLADTQPQDQRTILIPHADIAKPTLAEGLRAKGWDVTEVISYRTIPADPPPPDVRQAVTTGAITAICITSGSTIRNLIAIAGRPHPDTLLACIGPAAAEATKKLGLEVTVIPPVAEAESLADALAAYAQQAKPG